MALEKLIGYGVLALVGWAVISSFSTPAPNVKDAEVVPHDTPAFHFWRKDGDADGELILKNRSTGEPVARYYLGAGVLHQSPEQARDGILAARYKPHEYFGEWNFDIGPAVFGGNVGKHAVQPAIRLSPCRIGFGTVAPDAIASSEAGGVGISVYPPRSAVGDFWSHFGVGCWYVAPWGGGRPGLVAGVSASIYP